MIKKKLIHETISTAELSLAAALIAWNFPLNAINKTNQNKVFFVFLKNSSLDRAIQSFWNNTAFVNPKTYFNALRELKSRIHGG